MTASCWHDEKTELEIQRIKRKACSLISDLPFSSDQIMYLSNIMVMWLNVILVALGINRIKVIDESHQDDKGLL